MISIISVVGRNLEIGRKGDLAFKGKGELPYFKRVTMGHKVLMGLNTYRSLPKRLEGREYYVASLEEFEAPEWVNKIRNFIKFLEEQQGSEEEFMVIGGGQIYKLALPYASKLYLTEVDASESEADVFFPEFDKSEWKKELVGEGEYDDGLKYRRYIYEKK